MEEYNQPIKEAHEQTLYSRDGTKGKLLSTLEDQWVQVVERVAQADSSDVEQELDRGLQDLQAQATDSIQSAREEGQQKEREAHLEGYEAVATAAAVSVPDWDPDVSDLDPFKRRGVSDPAPRLVRSSIEKGISFFEQDLKFIRKHVSDRRYAQAAAQVLARGSEGITEKLLEQGVDLDVDLSEINPRTPRVLSNLKRTGATELSAIVDETAKELAARSPAVDLVEWTLSPSHGGSYAPDACDSFAEQDLHGYGSGLYHPESVPSEPHPHCECTVVTVLRPPEEWDQDKRPRPDKPSVTEAQVRRVLERTEGGRTITDDYVEQQAEQMQEVIDFVDENPRGV